MVWQRHNYAAAQAMVLCVATMATLASFYSSPRYHRMHHSREREDHDFNYGEIFAFWDFLFGTVNRRYCADPRVADRVEIGLEDGEDAYINARRLRYLIEGTWLPATWQALAWSYGFATRILGKVTAPAGQHEKNKWVLQEKWGPSQDPAEASSRPMVGCATGNRSHR